MHERRWPVAPGLATGHGEHHIGADRLPTVRKALPTATFAAIATSNRGTPMVQFLSKRRYPIAGALALVIATSAWVYARGRAPTDPSVVATVKRGEFKVVVTTAGELRARKFVQINLPQSAQQAGAYQAKIQSILPEGSVF